MSITLPNRKYNLNTPILFVILQNVPTYLCNEKKNNTKYAENVLLNGLIYSPKWIVQ